MCEQTHCNRSSPPGLDKWQGGWASLSCWRSRASKHGTERRVASEESNPTHTVTSPFRLPETKIFIGGKNVLRT